MNSNDFSMEIRMSSKNLHRAAEITGFNGRLVSGKASKDSYAEFIYNYMFVYKAIEDALDQLSNLEEIKPFVTKELYRSELIKKDNQFLLGDKEASMEILPSTKAYVNRIKEISKTNPILVVAHAYTRFLADLFGGRTIHQIVKDSYKIEDKGLNYFDFSNLDNIMEYVMGYRNNLTNMTLTEENQEAFLNEVANSYIYNIGISTELEAKLYGEAESSVGGHPAGIPKSGSMPKGHPPINGMSMPKGHPPINGMEMPKGHPQRSK